jgi:hypothetical protein
MARVMLVLYLVCYGCYIFYTREPDYFDGEKTFGTVNVLNDSSIVLYKVDTLQYQFTTKNYFNHFANNQKVEVIYQTTKPQNAAVYSFWTYWFNLKEFLVSLLFLFGCYYIAVELNMNPKDENVDD